MEITEIGNPAFHKFDELVKNYVDNQRLPQVIALVFHDDQIVYSKKWGFADIETKKEVEFDDIFRIASMTKPIVTLGALMLLEKGFIDLDDPLSKYIPKTSDLRVFVKEEHGELITEPLKREITILDLFIHTIGICYPRDLRHPIERRFYEFNKDYENKPLSQYVDEMLDIPLKVQPGVEWDYGLSIDILARVMEIVTGQDLEDFLQKEVLDVLGMKDTYYVVPSEKWGRLVKLCIKNGKAGLENAPKDREEWVIRPKKHKGGGGGYCSTLEDYLKFSICLMNNGQWEGKQLVKPEMIDLMMDEYVVSRNIPFEGLRGSSKTKEITRKYMKQYSDGYGQALGAQVRIENGILPKGIYGWAGAFTTDFWVDRKNKVVGIILSQLFPNFRTPIFNEFKELVYQGLQLNKSN